MTEAPLASATAVPAAALPAAGACGPPAHRLSNQVASALRALLSLALGDTRVPGHASASQRHAPGGTSQNPPPPPATWVSKRAEERDGGPQQKRPGESGAGSRPRLPPSRMPEAPPPARVTICSIGHVSSHSWDSRTLVQSQPQEVSVCV